MPVGRCRGAPGPTGQPAKNHTTARMIHATWACEILGKPSWIVGWRKGTRQTILVTWDEAAGTYRTDLIDENTGCANAMHFKNAAGQDVIVATNREIDEVAMYTVTA